MNKSAQIYLIVLAILYIIISIILYGYNVGGVISSNSAHWGEFGSYLSGVVGSGLATLSYFLLLINAGYYKNEILKIEETVELSQRKDQREELMLYIKMIENDINALLKTNICLENGLGVVSLSDIANNNQYSCIRASVSQHQDLMTLVEDVMFYANMIDNISSYKKFTNFYTKKYQKILPEGNHEKSTD